MAEEFQIATPTMSIRYKGRNALKILPAAMSYVEQLGTGGGRSNVIGFQKEEETNDTTSGGFVAGRAKGNGGAK